MAEHSGAPGASTGLEVAVIGMAGRFPGAGDLRAFWRNLRDGVESITFFTRDELLEAGTDPALLDQPGFVPAKGALHGADEFDAGLFGLTPRDAEIMDPQHRILLECAWAALEDAGYDPLRAERPVGVFAGSSTSAYVRSVASRPELVSAAGMTRIGLVNEKDQLAAGVSYRLNLRGPSLAVQTACSTSLVAVHLACQSLLAGESDMALAGGVSVQVPLRRGYLHVPGGILSRDGHCRPFDAAAHGTVGGSGAGLVVLKRLEDALADGDTIHAVIRGSAINNDGAQKVGYTAPSVTGQARVVSEALSVAGVDAATVQYLETHGTGTPLGDAIELQAIGQVLARGGGEHPCAIGSVKSNVGHLDAAAGVAGLIKTVLALKHCQIPPSLNCAEPHPEIAAAGGRVFVNTALRPWERNGTPRRAGVSSFGIGGTNVHVVLEEAPAREPSGPSRGLQLLVLSARTGSALARAAETLADHLEAEETTLADAAYTLQTGRRELEHRLAVVCRDAREGAARLREAAVRTTSAVPRAGRPVAFLFPGLGMHHVEMGRGLYDTEPVFRATVDECCELLRPVLGTDLREVLYAAAGPGEEEAGGGWDLRRLLGRGEEQGGEAGGGSPLDETRFAHPALFVTELALARLWMSWGVRPAALAGHSLGEYVAACVAGVFQLEDALSLVALRAQLVDALPEGAMLAVPLGEEALRAVLPGALDVAAVNTPESCVVAGPAAEVEAFEAALAERGTVSRRLPVQHAFHSRAMAAVAAELERLVEGFELRPPEIPLLSNVTGGWIADPDACSPAYWARHLCRTVRFADCVATLREEPGWALLEVGPGQTLGAWAMQHPGAGAPADHVVLSSLRHPHNRVPDARFLLETLGSLWAAGATVDWAAFSGGERRYRVPLPGYPFERKRYWVDPPRDDRPRRGAEDGAAAAVAVAEVSAGASHEKGPDAMANRLAAAESVAAPPARREAVLHLLKGIVADLTGIEEHQVRTDADFFQAGIDSLLLLQAIQAIEKRVGIRVSLVELLEEMNTLDALAGHIDRVLPPDAVLRNGRPAPAPVFETPATIPVPETPAPASDLLAAHPTRVVPAPPALFPAPASPAASAPSLPGGSAGESALERVIAQQLHLMAQQLAALGGAAASAPSAPAASASLAESPPVPSYPAPSTTAMGAVHEAAPPSSVPASAEVPQGRIQPETFVAYQPLNTETPSGLSPAQKEYLDGFIARYVERTRASKAHQARYHLPLADSRVTARFRRAWKEISYPIVSERARGSRIWDLDGNEYVDIGMGFGCNLFGHAPEFVTRAIREQAERGYGLGPQSPLAGRAAELVCELGGVERAVFCNSGTEAVMGAVRAARTFTGRSKVAYFAGSYHGWSDIVQGRLLTAGGRREVRPAGPGIAASPLQDVVMLDWDQPSSFELLAQHLDDLALVMVEPVQSRRPDIQPRAFLHELRRVTREAGVLLHFDELITGFRILPGGAQAHFGVDADLVTYGKIVAGGLPMGVVAGTREVMSVFDGGLWSYGDDSYPPGQRTLFAGAYFKHPISMAVACAVLEEVRRRGAPMYEVLNERTATLAGRLNAFFEAGRYPASVVHFGSMFRVFFGPEVRYPELFLYHLPLEGVYAIPETGTCFLSPAHGDDDLEKIFRAVCASVEAMRRGGFIPGPTPGGPGAGGETVATRDTTTVSPASDPAPASERGVRAVPLTEGQKQLWIESQMGDEAALAYIESTSVRLRGTLDVEALRAAVQGVVDRHDTLRATFGPGGDVQLVHPSLAVEVPLVDFRGTPPDGRGAEVEAWIRRTVRHPFDLARGPLARFALAAVGEDEHLLVVSTHHAALDGWSFGVVFEELGALYAAARAGRRAELPPPPSHAELVRAQVAAVEDPAAEAYWLAQFADGVPVLHLPTDRPRPPVRSYRGERASRTIGGGLVRRLAAAGRQHGMTVFNTTLAALFVWLGRLSGEDDLVIGTPAAGQAARSGAAELVGYGINVLPIRARLDARETFVEHARRVRRSLLTALEHQSFSFPRLVQRLPNARDASRSPLFSALMYLDRAREDVFLDDLRAGFESNFTGGAKMDLVVGLTESADELRVNCDYAAALFDGATIERWLDGFERILRQVAEGPSVRLRDLDLLGEGERRRVLEEWNRTDGDAPADRCIHELFEAQAARTPDAAAVVLEDRALTYRELDERANRLAGFLRRRGVGPEVRVGICLERGPEAVVAILGVLKAGGAYLPLDPEYPAERLGFMLEDAGAAVLLSREVLCGRVPVPPGVEEVSLDAAWAEIEKESPARPESAVTLANLAYVIYTSGSTGRPKGVMVSHGSLVNSTAARERFYPERPGAYLLLSSISFDSAVAGIFWTLCGGGTLVLPDAGELRADRLAELAERAGVTHLLAVPSLYAQLAAEAEPWGSRLEVVIVAGEPCPPELVERHRARMPGVALANEYGPTEATVWSSAHRCGAEEETAATVPIGRPVLNTRAYVLDAFLSPVPAGVPGELYVGGAQVARGYLGRPGMTAERFVPDPFSPAPGARLYRTGDRARWRVDGELEFLGRLDGQVKVRGFRVEPGEVETALRRLPDVAACAVVAREDAPGGTRLVAYVVGGADPGALRDGLRRTLPAHMVPAAFVALETLPLTPNGKVDRNALPAPEYASAERYVAPRTPVEEVVAGIWEEVLARERVGVRESFFELGGHSLLATRVVSRVRAVLGAELSVRAVFEGPTVAELAARVEAARRAGVPPLPPVVPVARGRPLPLSFAQERLYFLDRLRPGGAVYNVSTALRVSGPLDTSALERALGEIVRRHEVLRTTFREVDGAPAQVIAPFSGFALPVEDLSALDEAEREAEARRRTAEEAERPFDLAAGPLFRATLLRLGEEEHVLLLCMHHIVTDGWSMGVLFRELEALYAAGRDGGAPPLPPPALQYADYAAWQREWMGGEALDRHLAYWKEQLAGAPALLEIPADHPRPAVQSHRGARERIELSAALVERLEALGRREGATLYMVLLGAFQVLLSKYAGSEDVVVGSPVAGRTRRELEEMAGFFVNTLVLRTRLGGDPTFREVLRRVREVTLGAYEHQEVPFERLVTELRPERSLSHSPLFQVMFELHNAGGPAASLPGVEVRPAGMEATTTKFDLSLALAAASGGLAGGLVYSTDLFEPATVRRMAGHLVRVLEQAATDPGLPLSRLALVEPSERERMAEWNRTEAPYPADLCVHQLFETQARRTPDAVAVVFEDRTLTYRELDERANRLAHRLRRRGVGSEVRVGLFLERSPEMLVSLLGVLKAGGAYVPMDPAHPAERIAYMLRDSGVRVLLSQERLRERLAVPDGVEVVCADAVGEETGDGSTEPPASGVAPENLAYVIYTSGSTGRPKGVAMHHRGVANYIDWAVRAYEAGEGNGAAVFSSIAVDLTVTNLLPLFAGRPVRLLPEEGAVEALAEALGERPGFGLLKITPVHLGLLTPLLTPGDACGAARTLVIGGENLAAETTLFWQEHAPEVRLVNEYGPTETVVGCSSYLLPPGRHGAGIVPVGRPIQNLRFHVLDDRMETVAVGLPGELYIGGAGVARGYLGRPALSAERFLPDPFAGAGARMYRTGDRARWQADGNLLVLGRTDGQVKVRGFRVELGEIEAALRRREEVRDCHVMVREDRPGDRRLVAYLAGEAEPEALRAYLRSTLPEYMVPGAFVVMESFPQTPTGKLDPAALPPPVHPRAEPGHGEPRNFVEAQLIQIWEEVLGTEGIGPTESFFDLGGNSLLALRLFTRANRRLGCDLPVATLFVGATVRQMADAILEQRSAAPAPRAPVVPLQPHGSLPPLFLVHSADRDVMGYVNLVRHFGPEQPVYGVRDVGEDLARPVARIAAEHVAAIRAVQPAGPYYLASWSFGGIVAFEMALQLEREGETVAFVGLMDTISPLLTGEWARGSDEDLAIVLGREYAARRSRPLSASLEELRGIDPDEQVRRVVEALHAEGAAPPEFDAAALAAQCRMARDRIASGAGYVPGVFSGTLTLFRAGVTSQRFDDFFAPRSEEERHSLGWAPLGAGPLEVHPVAGDHATLASEPHVRVLARCMREALASARERAAGAASAEPRVPAGEVSGVYAPLA